VFKLVNGLSRRTTAVFTHSRTSVFNTTNSSASVIFIIAERYDVDVSPE
jgi:hypothetical protein